MKYNLIVSFECGSTVVWNQQIDDEWRITFESMNEALDFMLLLIKGKTTNGNQDATRYAVQDTDLLVS